MADSISQSGQTYPRVPGTIWADAQPDAVEGDAFTFEIERSDVDEVALHTFEEGEGSIWSIYWSRERAIEVATRILEAARVR